MLYLADNVDLNSALIGAVGAMIGGLLAAGANLLMERARGRRETAAHERQMREDMRRAARLLENELQLVLEEIGALHIDSRYGKHVGLTVGRGLGLWRELRGPLAVTLRDEQWERTAAAFGELNRLELLLAERRRRDPTSAAIVEPEDGLESVVSMVQTGRRSLASMLESTPTTALPERSVAPGRLVSVSRRGR